MHPGCDIEQVYLCREPIDFRQSINGLCVLVEQELELNPFGSALYVFTNHQRNKIPACRFLYTEHRRCLGEGAVLASQCLLSVAEALESGEIRLAWRLRIGHANDKPARVRMAAQRLRFTDKYTA